MGYVIHEAVSLSSIVDFYFLFSFTLPIVHFPISARQEKLECFMSNTAVIMARAIAELDNSAAWLSFIEESLVLQTNRVRKLSSFLILLLSSSLNSAHSQHCVTADRQGNGLPKVSGTLKPAAGNVLVI